MEIATSLWTRNLALVLTRDGLLYQKIFPPAITIIHPLVPFAFPVGLSGEPWDLMLPHFTRPAELHFGEPITAIEGGTRRMLAVANPELFYYWSLDTSADPVAVAKAYENRKPYPSLLEPCPIHTSIPIKQMVMAAEPVILTPSGEVYACTHSLLSMSSTENLKAPGFSFDNNLRRIERIPPLTQLAIFRYTRQVFGLDCRGTLWMMGLTRSWNPKPLLSTGPSELHFDQIAAGSNHLVLLTKEGTAWNYIPDDSEHPFSLDHFYPVEELDHIENIAAGAGFSLLEDNHHRIWQVGPHHRDRFSRDYDDEGFNTPVLLKQSYAELLAGCLRSNASACPSPADLEEFVRSLGSSSLHL